MAIASCLLEGISYPDHHRNVLLTVIGTIEGDPFRALRLLRVTHLQPEIGTQQDKLKVKPQTKAGTYGNVIGE